MTVDVGDEFEDDFEDAEDLAELLGLPERLPALRVPSPAELAGTARESALLRRTGALATWVGERRQVTADGELTAPDAAEAAERLGVGPAELLLCWEVALTTDLVVVSADDGEADANPDLWPTDDDGEDIDTWLLAFTQTLPSLEIDAELAGEEDLDLSALGSLMLPLFLTRTMGVQLADLRTMAHEIATEHLEDDAAWDAWVAAHGDPAEALLTRLTDHGAVEVDGDSDTARLTPLGLLAMREELVEGGIDIPLLPPTADMAAADLLSAVGGLTDEELAELTSDWLGQHEQAAPELLAAAAEAHPEARVHAVTVLGDVPGTPWESALDNEALRPYALVALDRDLEPADIAWLAVDLLSATADQLGAYDEQAVEELFGSVVPSGLEQEVLAAAWRLPHPETYEVLTLVGNHHPDKQVAKAARTAAHKARSAG